MSTWYYYDEKGDKIAVTGGQLKGLAKAGVITPETIIENEEGKSAPARKVKGLTFAVPTPSVETEFYGLASPPEPSPFTAPVPETKDTSVAIPTETTNPFTVPLPVAAKPVENPFTATMPTENKTVPQNVSVPVAENEGYKNPHKPIPIFVGIGALLLLLILIGMGVSYFGGSRITFTAEEQATIDKFVEDFKDDLKSKKGKEKLLGLAAYAGNLAAVKYLISKGVKVDAIPEDAPGTALAAAVMGGNTEVVKFLVSRGANVNYKDHNGVTPLDLAKGQGHSEIVEFLSSGKSASSSSNRNDSRSRQRDPKIQQARIQANAEIDKLRQKQAQQLVGMRMRMTNSEFEGQKRLFDHELYSFEHLTDLEFLATYGENLAGQTASELAAIEQAAEEKAAKEKAAREKAAREVLTTAERTKFTAAEQAEIEKFIVNYGNEFGSDLKAVDSSGNTSLHRAVDFGNLVVAGFLISRGLDVNAKYGDGFGKKGNTLLYMAVLLDKLEHIKFLIENGADVNVKGHEYEKTPLHLAKSLEAIKLLVSHGADVNSQDKYGKNRLHEAGNIEDKDEAIEVVKFLISHGADVNAKDNNGRTPLDTAKNGSLKSYYQVWKYLESIGAKSGK